LKRFEVLTAVKIAMFFWVVTPCGLVGRYQRFGETSLSLGVKCGDSPHGVTTQKNNIVNEY
jgi:hypothetical protein